MVFPRRIGSVFVQSTNSDCVSMKSQSASVSDAGNVIRVGSAGLGDPLQHGQRQLVGAQVFPQPLLARQIQIQPPHEDFHGGHPFLSSSTLGPAPQVFKSRLALAAYSSESTPAVRSSAPGTRE